MRKNGDFLTKYMPIVIKDVSYKVFAKSVGDFIHIRGYRCVLENGLAASNCQCTVYDKTIESCLQRGFD